MPDVSLLYLLALGFGVLLGTAGITVVASGFHKIRALTRENISLREQNALLSSRERDLLQKYVDLYKENKSLTTTREGVDLENLILREQLQKGRRIQERLREKAQAFTQDPGRGEASITTGNEIEVVQIEPPMIASPFEPYAVPGAETYFLAILIFFVFSLLIYVVIRAAKNLLCTNHFVRIH